MKKIFAFIVFYYNSTLSHIDYYLSKRKADRLHKLTGRRYHVIPGPKKLTVVDNTFIDRYNRECKGKKGFHKMTIVELIKQSYYSTSVQSITRKS